MKRLITTMIFVVIMSSVMGTYVIPRTITVDASTLNALRSSLLPASPSYDPYIADLSDSDDTVIPEGGDSLPSRAAPVYVDKMNTAVISYLQTALFNEGPSDVNAINSIVGIVLNDIPPDSIALNYFTNTSFEALEVVSQRLV